MRKSSFALLLALSLTAPAATAASADEESACANLLYNAKGQLVGAIGVSGDSSCADHNIAWRTRHTVPKPLANATRKRTPGER